MDTFAHGFWSWLIYHKRKWVWWAVLFGVLPDLLSFGVYIVYNIITGNFVPGRPRLEAIPNYVHVSYNITHSLVVFAAIFLLIYLLTKKWYWPFTAWALHSVIDLPTHTTRFFPTPILWPISSFAFDGISWGSSWFMALNYFAIILVFFIVRFNNKKAKNKKSK